MKHSGRPTKLTKEVQTKIINAIRGGLPVVSAAGLAGISEKTFYNWKTLGEEDETEKSKYFQFLQAVKTAERESEANLVAKIQTDESWQSKAWILERRFPSRWSRIEKREVKADVSVATPDNPEVQKLLEKLKQDDGS